MAVESFKKYLTVLTLLFFFIFDKTLAAVYIIRGYVQGGQIA